MEEKKKKIIELVELIYDRDFNTYTREEYLKKEIPLKEFLFCNPDIQNLYKPICKAFEIV